MAITPLVDVRHLTKHFSRAGGLLAHRTSTLVVDDVSFTVEKGETFGLVGESGSGKTTTGRCLIRLVEPTSGSVLFRGEDVLQFDHNRLRRARRDMQMVFQDPWGSLNPRMRVLDIVEEPLIIHGMGTRAERQERVAQLMRLVGLVPAHLSQFPHEFSGGQRQRIGLARALALNPEFLVLDEPVSALDVSIQAQVVNLLLELQERLGLTYLFITHDLRLVEHLCHRVAVMHRGRIVEMAPVAMLFDEPRHPYTRALLSAVPRLTETRMAKRWASTTDFESGLPLREVGEGHYAAV